MPQINPRADVIIEDGWYTAEIGKTEEKDTKFGERLMVPFIVTAGDEIVEITAFVSISEHPKSNVVKWGKALFGERPFDTDEFSGIECEVFVEEGEDTEGKPKNKIGKVRKLGKPAKKAKTTAASTATPTGVTEGENFDDLPF